MYQAGHHNVSLVPVFGADVSNRNTARKTVPHGSGSNRTSYAKLSPEEIGLHVKTAFDKACNDSLAFEDVFTGDRPARPFVERDVRAVLSPKEQSVLEDRVFALLSRMHNSRSFSVGNVPNSTARNLALQLFAAASVVYQAAFSSSSRPTSQPPGPEKLREAVGKISDCLEEAKQLFDSIPLLCMAVLRKGQLCGCLSSLLHKKDLSVLAANSNVYLEVMRLVKVLAEHEDLTYLMLDPVKNSLPCLADAVRTVGKEARSLLESVNVGYGSRLQDPRFKKMAHRVRSVYKIVKKSVRPAKKGHNARGGGSSDEEDAALPSRPSSNLSSAWPERASRTDSPSVYSTSYGGVPPPSTMPTVKEHGMLHPHSVNKSLPELSSVLSSQKLQQQQQRPRPGLMARTSYDGVPPLRLAQMVDSATTLYSPHGSFRSPGSSESGHVTPALLSAAESWHSASSLSPDRPGSSTFINPTFSPPRSRPSTTEYFYPPLTDDSMRQTQPTQPRSKQTLESVRLSQRSPHTLPLHSRSPHTLPLQSRTPHTLPLQSRSNRYVLSAGMHQHAPTSIRTAPVYQSFSNPLAEPDSLTGNASDGSDADEIAPGPRPYEFYPSLTSAAAAGAASAVWGRTSPVLMRSMPTKHVGYTAATPLRRPHLSTVRPTALSSASFDKPGYDSSSKEPAMPRWAHPALSVHAPPKPSSPMKVSSELLEPQVVSTHYQQVKPWDLQDSDVSVTYSALPTSAPPLLQPVDRMPLLSSGSMQAEVPTSHPELLAQSSNRWQPTALMVPFSSYKPLALIPQRAAALTTAPANMPLGGYNASPGRSFSSSGDRHQVDIDMSTPLHEHQHVALVGEICELSTAMVRYGNNALLAGKLMSLSDQFPRYRRIVGDGNCFYRAFVFGMLEQLLVSADQVLLQGLRRRLIHVWKVVKAFPELNQDHLAQQGHMLLLRILSLAWFGSSETGEPPSDPLFANDLEALLCTRSHSDALVQFVRVVTAAEMLSREDEYAPFVAGCDGERANMSIAALVSKYVVRMDQEAEELQIIALVRALDVCCGILDVAHSEVMFVKHPSKLQRPLFWLLHCPGHYDLVYPRHTCDVRNGALMLL